MTRAALLLLASAALVACNCPKAAIADARARATDVAAPSWPAGTAVPTLAGADSTIATAVRELLADGLDDDDAVRIALANDRNLHAELARLGVRAAAVVHAGLLRNPTLSAQAMFFSDGTEIELGLLQPFLDLFTRPVREQLAAQRRDEAIALVGSRLIGAAFDARRAMVELRAAIELETLARQEADAAAARNTLVETLHAAGNATDKERHAAAIARDEARLRLQDRAAEVFDRREALQVLLGLHGDATAWELAAPTPATGPSALGDLESTAVAASLELVGSRARIAAMAQEARLTRWDTLFGGAGIGPAARYEDGDWAFGPELTLTVPLWDRGGVAMAGHHQELEALLHEHTALAVAIRSSARRLRERALAAADRVAFLQREHLPHQAAYVLAVLQDYNAMQIGAGRVIAARQRELAARAGEVLARRAQRIAELDCQELAAGRFDRARPSGPSGGAPATAPGHGAPTEGGHE